MEVIFFTFSSPGRLDATKMMVKSLRAFGGSLARSQMWIFTSPASKSTPWADELVQIIPLEVPKRSSTGLFLEKIAACARAEELAPASTHALVWMDPCCLVVRPPELFALDDNHDAAFRPVHIRNVGLSPDQQLDGFWQGILGVLEMDDIQSTVTSFVDGQILRSYFNTHAFAINPSLGLMHQWLELFLKLDREPQFQAHACGDEIHQVFLFQALLSCLVVKQIPEARIRILPSTYNYPCHLHERVPPARRLATLNEAVCVTYEDLSIQDGNIGGLPIREPLSSWIADQARG